jgi:hypothetical protein
MVGLKAVKGTGKGSADLTFRPEGGMAETKKIPLEGKAKEDVRFDWEPSKPGKTELFLEIRSEGDPDPSNNSTREMIDVEEGAGKSKQADEIQQDIAGVAGGDAAIEEMRVEGKLLAGKPSKVEVKLKNLSENEMSGCAVTVSDGQGFQKEERVSFKKKGKEKIRMEYVPQTPGRITLKASLACPGDADTSNNEKMQDVEILGEQKLEQAGMGDPAMIQEGSFEEVKDGKKKAGFE